MEDQGNMSDEEVSDDEVVEEEATGPWISISMSKEQKKALRKPWRQSLIITLVGWKIGY